MKSFNKKMSSPIAHNDNQTMHADYINHPLLSAQEEVDYSNGIKTSRRMLTNFISKCPYLISQFIDMTAGVDKAKSLSKFISGIDTQNRHDSSEANSLIEQRIIQLREYHSLWQDESSDDLKLMMTTIFIGFWLTKGCLESLFSTYQGSYEAFNTHLSILSKQASIMIGRDQITIVEEIISSLSNAGEPSDPLLTEFLETQQTTLNRLYDSLHPIGIAVHEMYSDGPRASEAHSILNHYFSKLVNCNLRLVIKIATRYFSIHLKLADRVQEGTFGLHKAADKFDPDLGTRFSTYATWWIHQFINRAIESQDRNIRLPAHVETKLRKIHGCIREHEKTGDSPDSSTIALETGLSEEVVEYTLNQGKLCISLDTPRGEDSDESLLENVSHDEEYRMEDDFSRIELSSLVHDSLELLNKTEQMVLSHRFELNGAEFKTLENIGEMMGVTRERVRQIEIRALKNLRESQFSETMRGYI